MKRRDFIKSGAIVAGTAATGYLAYGCSSASTRGTIPSYLKGYEKLYRQDPRKAALEWFKDAKFGLFMHYGLYSLLEGHYKGEHARPAEWVLERTKIRLPEYEKLTAQFKADKFDADFITDLALSAGMKYVNITTRHHDSFCLWDTRASDFKSTNTPARRDLVAELAESCEKKGLGLQLYYSHGRDWRHPHSFNSMAPAEKPDVNKYLDFITAQVTELLTNYGPVAAIWLDGLNPAQAYNREAGRDALRVQELYDHIHKMQPNVLVSYKRGLLGTEDFMAPERHFKGELTKPLELCDTLQEYSWGYDSADEGHHKSVDDVIKILADAKAMPANLLLNTGPLPDGTIHPDDVKTLKAVGERLRKG